MAEDPVSPSTDTGFEVVRRGYDQGQVDTHLRTLDAHISILVTDRNAALEQSAQLARELDEARVRNEKLRAQVRTLVSPGQTVQGMSERMRTMLRLAQDEVADMLGNAETEVNRRIKEAEGQGAEIIAAAKADAETILAGARADAERMTQQLAQARAEFDAERRMIEERLAGERREAEQRIAAEAAEAEQDRARALAESEARRAVIEEDFAIAMDQRRAEALAALATERQGVHRELDQLREAAAARLQEEEARAKERARVIVADGERRLGELVEVRKRITEQLGDARAVLDRALASLSTPPEHRAGSAERTGHSENGVVPAPRDPSTDVGAASDEVDGPGEDATDTRGARRPRPRRRARAGAGRR